MNFFGVMLGTNGFTGDAVMGISAIIGFCVYFIHFAKAKTLEQSEDLPKDQRGKYPLYLDSEEKYFSPSELLKCHTEAIGSSGMGKTNIFNHMIEQGIKNGIGMLVFDEKSNYNKTIPCYASKHSRLHELKYFDLANAKRSQTYNPDEVFNGLMKSLFYGLVKEEYYRDQASDILSNLTTLLYK